MEKERGAANGEAFLDVGRRLGVWAALGAGGGLAVEALEMAMPSASGLWIFVAALVGLWGAWGCGAEVRG